MEYIYIKKYHSIYDTKYNLFRNNQEVYLNTGLKNALLREEIVKGTIPTYEDLCYSYKDINNCYNLLKKESIINLSEYDPCYNYTIHPLIEKLFYHLCGGNNENIDYLHRAIYHKYKNIDDVFMPCIIFHGSGGTGKNSFMNLLSAIFGEENTQILDGKSLHSNFSAYTGKKIIVGYDEVENNGHDKKASILSYLKSIVFSNKISIEEKYQKRMTINNIAWFFVLSNSSMPVILDEKDKGNRRFTIIRSDLKIEPFIGQKINEIVNLSEAENKGKKEEAIKIIKEYLFYLENKYGNDINKRIYALENKEKKDLEEKSETVGNLFFERFQEKYPNIKRFTVKRFAFLLDEYRKFTGDDIDIYDERYKPKYFNLGLSLKYELKVVNIQGQSHRMYIIKGKEGDDFIPLNK